MKRLLLAAAAASMLGSGAARADITVGVIYALTGPGSALGIPSQRAVALGPTEIGGEKVRYIVLDDASDPSTAVKNARKLIEEDKVDIILGPTNTPQTVAVINVTYELKVPQISNAPVGVPGEKGEWLVSVPQPSEVWILPIVKDMKKRGVKTVAFIGFTDPWGDLCYDGIKALGAQYGIQVITNERYSRTDTSVNAQVLKMLAAKPDAIFVGGSGTPGALPHLALAERNWKGPTYETPAVFMKDFLRVGGAAVEGMMAVTGPIGVAEQLPESNPIRAVALDFLRKYDAQYGPGSANAFAGYGYDSVRVFADAAARALKHAKPGTPDFRRALRDEILQVKDLVGVHGIYTFTKGNSFGVDERASELVKVEKGEWKLVP